jgi:hypothetical protein
MCLRTLDIFKLKNIIRTPTVYSKISLTTRYCKLLDIFSLSVVVCIISHQ